MKDTEIFDAIAHIDEDLIDRCLAEDETVRENPSEPASAVTEVKPLSARRIMIAVLAAAAALLLFFGLLAILHIGGKRPIGPVNAGTEAPTADAAVKRTPEPGTTPEAGVTDAPTEEPTAIPPPDEQWMLDQAWPYAQAANEALGLSFEKEKAEYSIGEEECFVSLVSEDACELQVCFHAYDQKAWKLTGNTIWPTANFMSPELYPGLDFDYEPVRTETAFVTDAW